MDRKEIRITVEEVTLPALKVSTLDCQGLTNKRGDGNTTRQINFAIERLFKGDRVIVVDHFKSFKASVMLLTKIVDRLVAEHRIDFNKVVIDQTKLEIELK